MFHAKKIINELVSSELQSNNILADDIIHIDDILNNSTLERHRASNYSWEERERESWEGVYSN